MFHFDGGAPPWTSGLSQGTALQVLARAWSRFKEPAYLTAAQQALGIFQTPPPAGVRVARRRGRASTPSTPTPPATGSSTASSRRSSGLYDYTSITKDPLGLAAVRSRRRARRARRCPSYDTGAWSLYDQYGESDLNYHELLTEFLQHLCERTQARRAAAPPRPATPPRRRRPRHRAATGGADGRPARRERPRRRRRRRRRSAAQRRGASAPERADARSRAMRSTARPRSASPPT